MSNSYFYEWCKTVTSRSGIMIPKDKLQVHIDSNNTSGFRSVYGFHPDHAKEISKRGNSKGFSEYPCFADELFIDIDTGDEGREKAEALVQKAGLKYKLYSSGGKGYHIVIPCKPIYSFNVPYSQKKFVESLGITPDESIYRFSGIISLEGRIHRKTKQPKKIADIPLISRPVFESKLPEDFSEAQDGFERAAYLTMAQPREGNRYMDLWRCLSRFYNAGFSKEFLHEVADRINESWDNPKPADEIDRLMSEFT